MKFRKAGLATATALTLALTASACGDGGDDSGDGGDKIKVGIKFDQPGIGQKTPDGFTGFDVDVATYVAKELGYEADQIEWVETPSPDRENALKRGDVKFIAASYSITDERDKLVDFAGPYLLAHQDLLVKVDSDISKGTDLNGKNLCSVSGSTSAQNVKKDIAPDANLKTVNTYSECLEGLAAGSIDALTTDDSILAGYAAQDQYKGKFKLAGLELSNENYGIGIKDGDKELQDKINKALEKMVEDGAWQDAVTKNFGDTYENEPAPQIGNIVK
ncbi:glutamate ABC transporter substrate-binding protein [Streptomyces sp. KLOTTS4A1]|uniref:glutamate ABC transporter substrate-binding protein n=1 Tax=Streptomyces sp. KLOTTS4A1 TaxID=3390996 RepID=UPI0039F52F8D